MKNRQHFVCAECSTSHPKWQGQCAECGVWNSLETVSITRDLKSKTLQATGNYSGDAAVTKLADIEISEASQRWSSCDPEFDRVLGGGLVAGSVV